MANLQINRLAIHYINKRTQQFVPADAEFNLTEADPRILDFFANLVGEVWDAEDKGSTRSAKFGTLDGQTTRGIVEEAIGAVLQDNESFFATSHRVAEHLYQVTPASASPGLLAVMRVTHVASGNPFVAMIKIRHKDEDFIKSGSTILTQIEIEEIDNLLNREIQKGALIPHPERPEYDLKAVDQQATEDPARYFTESFLGSRTKPSDEQQIKGLTQVLGKYAKDRGISLKPNKLPRVVRTLQERQVNVTTAAVAEIVEAQQLYSGDFDRADFSTYVSSSDVGNVNIPPEHFSYRGRTKKAIRQYKLRFKDPQLRGLVISGPVEVIERITSVDGEQITFHIETTRDGYDEIYE